MKTFIIKAPVFLALVSRATHGETATAFVDDPLQGTIVLERNVLPTKVSSTCNFEGRTITLSHPQSIDKDDRYFRLGSTSLQAVTMTIDHINLHRCGVQVEGQNYALTLQTLGDRSDPEKHRAIGEYLVNQTDFLLAGYSSGLTQHLTPVAESAGRVVVSGGSSRPSVFVNRFYAFGVMVPSTFAFDTALEGVRAKGAQTLSVIYEQGTSSCVGLGERATSQFGFTAVSEHILPETPNTELDIQPLIQNLTSSNPDVLVNCMRLTCGTWIQALRDAQWNPNAQIFGICGGAELEHEIEPRDLQYILLASSWNQVLRPPPDAVTQWTPQDFATHFFNYAHVNATYQHAAAATAVSVLVQAMERANTTNSTQVRQELAMGSFDTIYGQVSFDRNGQNQALFLVLQYDSETALQVASPASQATTKEGILYPMPTWAHRDCVDLSSCVQDGGTCSAEGVCECSAIEGAHTMSLGVGGSAKCRIVPEEDLNHVPDALIITGLSLLAIQCFMSLFCMGWTFKYRETTIVKASQPFFLYLIAFGCLVMASSILPASMQGDYRYARNETTWELNPDQSAANVARLDAACMAFPWLASLGFAIIFSALFTKVLRVKRLLVNAERCRRQAVEIKDVILVMVATVTIEMVILLTWQLVDPLTWNRSVSLADSDGFALVSVGECRSDSSTSFLIPCVPPIWPPYFVRCGFVMSPATFRTSFQKANGSLSLL